MYFLCGLFVRKPTEIQWRYTEEGERVRVSVRTGRIIPKPVFQRKDGIVPQQWKGAIYEEVQKSYFLILLLYL